MKVSLQTSTKYKYGATNILPLVGEVTFSESGQIEVDLYDENELILLLTAVPDLSVYVQPEASDIKPQVTENDLGKAEDEKNDIAGEKDAEIIETGLVIAPRVEDPASILDTKTVKELKELAAISEFPAAEWKDLTKVPLLKYLNDKLTATA